jgi:hypothetical protein
MVGDTAYTLALWRVKEGREVEFVEAWKGLSDYFLDLPNPPGTGTLIRSAEDPRLFYSFGPWRSLEDIQRMRSDPHPGDDRQANRPLRGGQARDLPGGHDRSLAPRFGRTNFL